MARLYDRVVSGPLGVPAAIAGWFNESEARRRLNSATVVSCDNVARYMYMENNQEYWGFSDMPCVVPPLDNLWVEYRAPSHVVSCKHGTLRWGGPSEIGWLFMLNDIRSRPDHYGWTINAHLFVRAERRVSGPLLGIAFHADKRGSPIPGMRTIKPNGMSEQDAEKLSPFCWAALLALSFMHCKNVEQREVEQPAPLDKKWRKKHGRPLVKYRVLDIDPMRKVLKTEGRSDEVGLKRALRICRGHFATYTEDAPLFGRFVGTVWKSQHVRGTAEAGAVVKDYRVKAPRGAA